MILYRITRACYADLSGAGAKFRHGRWHGAGQPVLYTAATVALAAVEYAVHTGERPLDAVLLELEVPDSEIETIEDRLGGPLPGNWAFVEKHTRDLGRVWLESLSSIGLSVPSVVIPTERNVLLNPLHTEFRLVRERRRLPFFFDHRLFRSESD